MLYGIDGFSSIFLLAAGESLPIDFDDLKWM